MTFVEFIHPLRCAPREDQMLAALYFAKNNEGLAEVGSQTSATSSC